MRNVSTDVSASSLVIPVNVRSSGFFAKSDTSRIGSRKYPTARPPPQSCATRLPPTTTPGLYFSAVPDSLISTAIPFVSLSSNRKSEAS